MVTGIGSGGTGGGVTCTGGSGATGGTGTGAGGTDTGGSGAGGTGGDTAETTGGGAATCTAGAAEGAVAPAFPVGAGAWLTVVGRPKRLGRVDGAARRSFFRLALTPARIGWALPTAAGVLLRGAGRAFIAAVAGCRGRCERLDTLVPDAGGDGPRGHDCGGLEQEVGSDRRAAGGDGASSGSEERRERARQRHRAENAECLAVQLEPTARAEEQRLDRADGEIEDAGDLLVAAALELAHHDRGSLIEGEGGERGQHRIEVRALLLDRYGLRRLVERDLVRPAAGLAPAHPADVVRDRDQPVVRLVRPLAALVGAVGVEERRLSDVLGVGGVGREGERVLVDLARVLAVELLEGRVGGPLQPERCELPQRLPCSRLAGRAGCLHVARTANALVADTGRFTPWLRRVFCSAGGSRGRARRARLP